MSRTLPPLNALRAFEAAARQLSFTRAAEELHVTQSAISHQIKTLENHLGLSLFRRVGRNLLLTEAGQTYFPAVRRSLDELAAATARLAEMEATGVLTVSLTASFAAKWLVPRLPRFQARHPDIEVRIFANDSLIDFARDDVDVAIRLGTGGWLGLRVDLLFKERVTPVCSPTLMDGRPPLREPSDLRHHVLLQDEMGPLSAVYPGWAGWLSAAGVQGIDADRGPRFSHSLMALQAAIDGQGLALGPETLIVDDLAVGRLIRPFDLSLPAGFSYWVVCPETAAGRPKVAAFRDWLREESAWDKSPVAPKPAMA